MSIETDIAQFNAELDKAIENTMKTKVFEEARACILTSVFPNVYEKYNWPYPPEGKDYYERRYDEGGLGDPENIELVSDGPTGTGYEIEVRDMAPGIYDQDPIDEVIESGVGYDWIYSEIYRNQPYPRPFYEDAENMMITNGRFESALRRGLMEAGFAFD